MCRTGAAIALMRHAAAIRVRRLRTGVDADANHKGTQMIPRSCTLTKPGQVPPGAWRGRSTTLSVPKKSTHAWKGQLPAQGIGTCAATKTFPQMNRILETTCKKQNGSRILREHFKSFKNLSLFMKQAISNRQIPRKLNTSYATIHARGWISPAHHAGPRREKSRSHGPAHNAGKSPARMVQPRPPQPGPKYGWQPCYLRRCGLQTRMHARSR